jgi:hypothetical protein
LMVVAGDETDPVQAALLKGFQKSAPMEFGVAQSAACPQDGAMSVLGDTDGNKDSTVSETSVDTDFYDTAAFLEKVRAVGYKGPVGFQGFGIRGEPREVLARTIKFWRKMNDSSGTK